MGKNLGKNISHSSVSKASFVKAVPLNDGYEQVGTEGTDTFFFQGELGQFTSLLVNPYSGDEIFIDEEKYVNSSSYDGAGGNDFMFLSDFGDVLLIEDAQGNQTIANIENFFAGDGGDIIILASDTIEYGDVQIFGGGGDDILWSNIGNDFISGSTGNDHIHGGPGDDQLFGDEDNDIVMGGEGNDFIDGGTGDDILYGGNNDGVEIIDHIFEDDVMFPDLVEGKNIKDLKPPGDPSLGVEAGNLVVDYDAMVEITFLDGFAGYNNTFGFYEIAPDGTISNPQILYGNVKDAGVGVTHTFDLPVGADGGEFAFFIIGNGDNVNNYADDITDQGAISFVYDFGGPDERPATVDDDGSNVTIVYDDGVTQTALNGPHYHTTQRGEGETDDDYASINSDGITHVISGLGGDLDGDSLIIGFEDLPYLGDADFEDVLFEINIVPQEVPIVTDTGSDTLIGGAGDDILYGEAGDDILIVGEGLDQIYGGDGADIIQYDVADGLMDVIHGFEFGVDGDVLDISAILEGFDPMAHALEDFVQLIDNGEGITEIFVNADGAGDDFVGIASFDAGLSAADKDLFLDVNLQTIV